ncbi:MULTISPECIES: glutamine amidotransferase [Gulbenkiania]|uniref:GMP synthase-Glutamine amidotransferase domain n=1 Tax=Gulbenkiania indica TaxID=375574 RepID=A0A0K6GYL2_9NEIS|nr:MULTISPECIES: glutamine amidotransferase [Gulbenkiania]CUA83842.1 GMP synthase-Glutamine amidotransferase domain [Gulbenkiania indica]
MKNAMLIIRTGQPPAPVGARLGQFADWLRREFADCDRAWQEVHVAAGEPLPPVANCAGAVITGSPAMVTDHLPWSEATAAWIREAVAAEVPLLGICYGHQLIAYALGGEVGYHPDGPEVGVVDIQLKPAAGKDALFHDLPPVLQANVIHWQTVLRLPPGAVHLAGNAYEPHHAYRCGSAWGMQFHPEFDQAAMAGYIETLAERLRNANRDPDVLLDALRPTPMAGNLLARFSQLVCRRRNADA